MSTALYGRTYFNYPKQIHPKNNARYGRRVLVCQQGSHSCMYLSYGIVTFEQQYDRKGYTSFKNYLDLKTKVSFIYL